MNAMSETESGTVQAHAPLTDDEKSLILCNLRLTVAERLKRHDAALHTLNQIRAAVRASRGNEVRSLSARPPCAAGGLAKAHASGEIDQLP